MKLKKREIKKKNSWKGVGWPSLEICDDVILLRCTLIYIYIQKGAYKKARTAKKKKIMKREKTTEELKDAVLFDCWRDEKTQ